MPAQSTRPSPLSNLRLAGVAMVLIAVFPVIIVVLNLVQLHSYHPIRDAVSLLALGNAGVLLDAAFFLLGLGIWMLARVLATSVNKAVVGPVLMTVAGLAAITSGIFHTNADGAPSTTMSNIHMFAGITVFLSMIATMFVFAWRFRRDPAWRRSALPTLVWAIAGAATFLLIPVVGDARFGIAQRLHIAVWLSWLLFAGLRARQVSLADLDARQPAPSSAITPHATLPQQNAGQ
jgi:hypothetical protein